MFELLLSSIIFGFVVSSKIPTWKSLDDIRIVGGSDISIAEAPYQVSIVNRGRHSCGGTIVTSDIVITAAHCIMGANVNDYQIRAGSSTSANGGQLYPVGEIISHPGFNYVKMDNDIAIIWVTRPFQFGDEVAAVEMLDEGEEINDGAETIVTGWGHIKEGGGVPSTLQKVIVPVVSEEKCNEAYEPMYTITPRMICAGLPAGGKDACQGDSGGPMLYGGRLAGVVSWGLGCARPDYPGVYAKVSALRSWVEENIKIIRLKHVLRGVAL